jgi:putative PEP-CTERM system histidine kinase
MVTEFGGSWSIVFGIAFTVLVCAVSVPLLVSRSTRGRIKVFLTKAFSRYKYDYRREWLRFIGTLSESGLEDVPRTAVRAVAPIVNSPGGVVWIQEDDRSDYLPFGTWRCDLPAGQSIGRNSSLVRFLCDSQWVIDLSERQSHPKRYGDLKLDEWFEDRSDYWLVVPLLVGKQLLGMIVLLKPSVVPALNFEDHDLLKTVGRHVATHIKQAELDKRLSESKQFGTYHRLSAFLMHDMNNLIAQQSLVVKNAEKFRHDPKFIDDTIDTIAHSVARMRRLMEQLSRDSRAPASEIVRMRDVVKKGVERTSPRQPVPTVSFASVDPYLNADADRLTVVIEHLIRNAQDATSSDGLIEISACVDNGMAIITISDSGCGMSPKFISERLFRPFDSTKGSENMGIGAYQAREYARMIGGQLEVQSQEGRGTKFILRLPVADHSPSSQ